MKLSCDGVIEIVEGTVITKFTATVIGVFEAPVEAIDIEEAYVPGARPFGLTVAVTVAGVVGALAVADSHGALDVTLTVLVVVAVIENV